LQNIDLVYLFQPLIAIFVSVGLVVYWHYRRSFRMVVLVFSFLAYATAIALKVVLQSATLASFESYFGTNLTVLGLYFGVQTMVFEVGLAYLVSSWAVHRRKLRIRDSEAFGLGLALWENAGLLGVLTLFSLLSIQLALSAGGQSAQELYASLLRNRPDFTSSVPP
jgi:hypothetical protein